MNEKVNYTLFYSFLQKGFSVIRFNFAGVGNTEGVFEAGETELTDASTVVDWIQEQNEEATEFWLAGVGFGSWIAMQILMRRIEITGYVAVSPNVKKFDFSFFNPAPCDGIIIGAGNDIVISEDSLKNLVSTINKQKAGKVDFKSIPNANHNYEGKLKNLFELTTGYIDSKLKK